MRSTLSSLIIFSLAFGSVCPGAVPSLKDAYKDKLLVGAALNASYFSDNGSLKSELVKSQFNTITPENVMKWEEIHPQLNQYHFEPADRFVEFGAKNGMFVVGHNLVWHQQVPKWVYEDATGNPLTRNALLAR